MEIGWHIEIAAADTQPDTQAEAQWHVAALLQACVQK
jgi:hypothetical protein